MGRGPKSIESRVSKRLEKLATKASFGSSSSSGGDMCLFSFTSQLKLSFEDGSGIQQRSAVAIVPNGVSPDRLDLFLANRNLGPYVGPHRAKISDCIKKGFIYTGTVDKVIRTETGIEVEYSITGGGR